jgi:diguanylate cyclase (GGDEF)-like protein
MDMLHTIAERTLDERLSAGSEVLFRDFKRQEERLLAYANFFEQLLVPDNQLENIDEVGILLDRLFNTLEKENISVTLLSPSDRSPSPFPALKDLFAQVQRSHQPRFRYTDQLNGLPTLIVAAPLRTRDESSRLLLLQVAMGDDFLARACKPLGLSASLHDLDGKVLATSEASVTPMKLQAEQLTQMASSGRIFAEHDSPDGPVRHLFTLVPLGTSDMIMLSLQSSVTELAMIQQTLVTQLLLTIGAALLIGAMTYYLAGNAITRPARELNAAAKALSQGNLAYRIQHISSDELGTVAETFNEMAGQLETIYQEKAEKETAMVLAQQEARNKAVLVRKNLELEKTNKLLHAHQLEISALYQLNQAMVSAPDLDILFDRVLQVVVKTFNSDQIVMLLYNPGESLLEVVKSLGLNHETLRDVKFRLEQGITGLAATNRRQVYVKDVEKDPRYLNYHGQGATRGSFVSSPLAVKGRLVGVLNLHKREANAFVSSELEMVQAIANQTAIVIENTQLIEKVRDLSNIDDLTGLVNRRHFQDILKREVAQARRFNSNFSILMCDIDHFAEYTTRHGRLRSDSLLRQVGQVLLNNTRGIDLVCRFRNEEFVIMLPKTDKQGGVAVAEKLLQCIIKEEFPGAVESQPGGRLTVSFGVTEFPIDSKNIYELLNLADRALDAAKKEGCNRAIAWEGPEPSPE